MQRQPMSRFTEAQYLVLEDASEDKHEFVNGEIYAMAGGSYRHNRICNQLAISLGARLRSGPCAAVGSDQRINVSDTGLYTYPDLAVVCGEPTFHPRSPVTVTNPSLLAEVISESTEEYDRGAKLAHYRRIPSLRVVLLVAQDRRDVEVHRRLPEGGWAEPEIFLAGEIPLPEFDTALPLDEIYERTGV